MALSLLALLGACGGGGGGTPPGTPAPPPPPTPVVPSTPETYLFIGEATTVSAIDPADPTTVIAVDVGDTSNHKTVQHGTVESGVIKFIHNRTIIYIRDKYLFKVSALKESGAPAPKQLSNESSMDTFCNESMVFADYNDHNNARFLYEAPGADADCTIIEDNVWKMVKVGMNNTESPLAASAGMVPLGVIRTAGTLAIAGFIVKNGLDLQRVGPDFETPVLITSFTTSANVLWSTANGNLLLETDGEFINYRPGDNTYAAARHTASGSYTVLGADDTNLFFIEGDIVYRLPLDGSAISSIVVDETDATKKIGQGRLTTDRLVYLLTVGDIKKLMAIDKAADAGTAVELINPVGTSTDSIIILGQSFPEGKLANAGKRVYWNNTTTSQAGTVVDDGSLATTYPSSQWAGWLASEQQNVAGMIEMSHVIRVTDDTVSTGKWNVISHAAGTGAISATLGSIDEVDFAALPHLMAVLMRANYNMTLTTLSGDGDVRFFNAATDNSLVQVIAPGDQNLIGNLGCALRRGAPFDPLLPLMLIGGLVYLWHRRTG